MAVDLHAHTTFSDGTLTPKKLVERAIKHKLKALAITDHDEIGGNRPAMDAGHGSKLHVVPGVELSIDYKLEGTAHLHLLGLFIDPDNTGMQQAFAQLRSARRERGYLILEKLKALNIDINPDELDTMTAGGSVGRPHIAQLMIKTGAVSNVYEAFSGYLSKGKPAYVSKEKLRFFPATELIHEAGGLAVLAHPISLHLKTYRDYAAFFNKLKREGLDGVEVYYPSHNWNFTKGMISAAQKHGLLLSGGSDFHGSVKPDIELGVGRGKLYVPDKVFLDLQDAATERHKAGDA